MLETDNTRLAREHLAGLTDKPVIITTLQQMAQAAGIGDLGAHLGVCRETADNITIAVDPNKPETHEATFVHELLHRMLDHKGFPQIWINDMYAETNVPRHLWRLLPQLQSRFSSVLQHPEIYRRMREDYKLDMERYFDSLLIQKVGRFNKRNWRSEHERTFLSQQDILDGLEYFYYDANQKTQILSCFKDNSESAYNSCLQLHRQIEKIGTHTAHSCLKSAKAIKAHIIKYGEKRNLHLLNNMWESLDIRLEQMG